MTDPKRWSDTLGELSAEERRVFEAGHQARAPRAAKRAVWLALAAELPSAAAAASAGSAITAISLLKSAGIGLLLGAGTMSAVAVVRHQTTPAPPGVSAPALSARAVQRSAPLLRTLASARAPVEVPVVPPAASGSTRSPRQLPAPPTPLRDPTPRAASPAGEHPSTSAIRNESRRVAEARALLRSGRSREALDVLERVGSEFPNGALSQETEALAIEALVALGRHGDARARAAAFVARHPDSPHTTAVRRALD